MLPSEAGFVNYGEDTVYFVGVAVSGMVFSAPLNHKDLDPLYPGDGSDPV